MTKHLIFLSLVLMSVLLLGLGCDDRGTGIPQPVNYEGWSDWPTAQHSFDSLLTLQLGNPNEVWLASAYIPKRAMTPPVGQNLPTPVLILLPPQDGDKFFYERAGLIELAQELTATGEIEPMIILCPSNAGAFGGMFYGNSPPAGEVDTILGGGWLEFIGRDIPAAIDSARTKHGIGGIGMGAYGALRAAMKATDASGNSIYGSVSAVAGPFDFDAGGNGGLTTLFDDALAEQLSLTAYNTFVQVIDTNGSIIDTNMVPADTFSFKKFDSGDVFVSLPLSRLFIGGALAFSPHDTAITWSWNSGEPLSGGNRAQILTREVITDSTTMIDSLTGNSNVSISTIFAYHLPFDSTGALNPTVWSLWMRNNLDSLFLAGGGTQLDSTDLWLANNPGAKWNYYDMTNSFISFLDAQIGPGSFTVYDYSGINGTTTTESSNVYDVLRQMLIFHSKSFQK